MAMDNATKRLLTEPNANELVAKLRRTLQAQQELGELKSVHERQFKHFYECLRQLGQHCKGQNVDLDNQLNKLANDLAEDPDLATLLPAITQLSHDLQRQQQINQRELGNSRDALLALTGRMAQLTGLPETAQRELSFYQKELRQSPRKFWEFLPQFNQLIRLYESLIVERMTAEAPLEATPRHRQLAHELSQLLSDIEFSVEHRDIISALKAELAGEISPEQLLESYHQVLSLLMADIEKEKVESKQFLYALNDALGGVRESLSESWRHTVGYFGKQHSFSNDLTEHFEQLDDSVSQATELDQLKRHLQEELGTLTAKVQHRSQAELQELAQLRSYNEQLTKELHALANEANSYKEQLIKHQRLNLVDSLTQLPNRAALDEQLKKQFRNHRRYGKELWVAVADIDHFKSINDRFGHIAGDKTLQVVAMALQQSLRKGEFVARYGGEEFVFIVSDISKEDMIQLLERIRERLRSIPFKFRDDKVVITISMGMARVEKGETIHETFERADAALYRAKRNGRDRLELDD